MSPEPTLHQGTKPWGHMSDAELIAHAILGLADRLDPKLTPEERYRNSNRAAEELERRRTWDEEHAP